MLFYESYSVAQGMDWKYMLNKSVHIDTYICVFCSIIFGKSSEPAAEAAALVPLATVAA